MKRSIISLLIGISWNACFSQIKDAKIQEVLTKTTSISVYKMSRKSRDCEDKKNAMISVGKSIDPCFHLTKKLDSRLAARVIELFSNENSYSKPDSNCFTTDFAMVLFDNKMKEIGTITMSLVCMNLSINNRQSFTLTDKANHQLLNIIR